jgi:hypothetical protein
MIVQGGAPISFNYTAYDQRSDMFIQASIYDVTGVSPVLISQIPMTHVAFGSYIGKFTPSYNRIYQVIKVVYTDATFTTPDPQRAPDVDDYSALALQNLTGADIIAIV